MAKEIIRKIKEILCKNSEEYKNKNSEEYKNLEELPTINGRLLRMRGYEPPDGTTNAVRGTIYLCEKERVAYICNGFDQKSESFDWGMLEYCNW